MANTDYLVHENQTLFDVSLHVYGHCDAVFDLSALNELPITQSIKAGTTIKLVPGVPNLLVTANFEKRNIVPTTAIARNINAVLNTSLSYQFPSQF